ncbi:hypothetical protein NIE88_19495 [Sporolactobacillus shoreicorticis]|uniref:Uncharacterized protein n=1 Tax=Sporolactobacillus shoreicorticis TaxID=1923877 RepID=A0ABW5RYW7_9BACL|nr:hypothetical protein [Sporolactobacillus shoreicorticis]MCO7127928.1 hypothetical protein [Sporolactobacillus shoreicorticis]
MNAFVKNLDLTSKGLWVPMTFSILLLLFALFMKKKQLTWRELYLTYGVFGFIAWMLDSITGNMFDFYDVGNAYILGLGDFMAFSFIPSSLAVIFLNFRTEKNKWFMAVLFILISMLFYWGTKWAGYFRNKGWSDISSLVVFILAYCLILPLHLRIMRHRDRNN